MKTFHDETQVYDLDNYGIKTLAHIPFSKRAEEISLFNNNIENPGEISSLIEDLTYLRALWLNGNPVVENCVNFTNIGEYFSNLEIINSRFTSKAADWALLFYARD